MKVQGALMVLALATAIGFAWLNPTVIARVDVINLPGVRTAEAPATAMLVMLFAASLVLMLALGGTEAWLHARARRRLEVRLAQRESEIAEMERRTLDNVSDRVDSLRKELTDQMADLRSLVAGSRGHGGTPAGG
ncbi:MAG: hypothetical protein HY660_04265 [Armatimonadetes bacterium]|nr:hypothetical protein [Armatimonadota bacterium]